MALFELFSKRKRRARGEFPDVYLYDDVPQQLRVQIVHIFREIYSQGETLTGDASQVIEQLGQVLCREYGIFHLVDKYTKGFESLANFILQEKNHERVLDAIELIFRFADQKIRASNYHFNRHADVDKTIEELNTRFKEAGVGYQYASGDIIRVDSELLHSEAVKPTLSLLRKKMFSTVNQEFLYAHECYRHGKFESCLVEANKSLESMLKIICTEKGWAFDQRDTAKKLIAVCLQKNLVPIFMQNQLNTLQSILESGVPTMRNKLGGHGQGAASRVVPDYMAEYAMHLTASMLLMLGKASGL